MSDPLIERIEELIEPSLEAMGYELVRVSFGGEGRPRLQVMAERADRVSMTVEDCARISRDISAILDVEDPIDAKYELEVSSPGIDRPLTRIEDFERFAGLEARVELKKAVDGRKRFRGRLAGLTEGDEAVVLVDEDGERIELPVGEIQRAKLMMNDELLEAARAEQAADA